MDDLLKETLETALKNIENPRCADYLGPLFQSGYRQGVKDIIQMIKEKYDSN